MKTCLLTLLSILIPVCSHAQDQIYLVTDSGQVLRWDMTSLAGSPGQGPPQRLPPVPGIGGIGSIAVDRRSVAYVNTGVDGDIYRTDGRQVTRV